LRAYNEFEGRNTAGLDFAFDCSNTREDGLETVVRHSFGIGDLDDSVEFDSDVKCDRCTAPSTPLSTGADSSSTQTKLQTIKTRRQLAMPLRKLSLQQLDTTQGSNQVANDQAVGSDDWTMSNTVAFTQNAVSFGPDGCVSLYRSNEGTCIMKTHCTEEVNLRDYDFKFSCLDSAGGVVVHDFGKNSLSPEETFDSLLPCDKCLPPTSLVASSDEVPPAVQAPLTVQEETALEEAASPAAAPAASPAAAPSVPVAVEPATPMNTSDQLNLTSTPVFYGPNSCVSTYRSKSGSCVMKTQCESKDIEGYMFGLICMGKRGDGSVRHLFGKASFKPQETFDTLLLCDQCLGLPDSDNNTVDQDILDEVKHLKATVGLLAEDVKELQTAVYQPQPVAALRHRRITKAQHREVKSEAALEADDNSVAEQEVSKLAEGEDDRLADSIKDDDRKQAGMKGAIHAAAIAAAETARATQRHHRHSQQALVNKRRHSYKHAAVDDVANAADGDMDEGDGDVDKGADSPKYADDDQGEVDAAAGGSEDTAAEDAEAEGGVVNAGAVANDADASEQMSDEDDETTATVTVGEAVGAEENIDEDSTEDQDSENVPRRHQLRGGGRERREYVHHRDGRAIRTMGRQSESDDDEGAPLADDARDLADDGGGAATFADDADDGDRSSDQ